MSLNRTGEVCPACGEGTLQSVVDFSYGIPFMYSVCNYCESELTGQEEGEFNILLNK